MNNSMGALYELSGIGRRKRKTKEEKKAKKTKRKEKRKQVFKKVAKVGLVPARASFLLVVKLNALKIASRLVKAYEKNPQKVKDFWSKFGGDWEKLKQAMSTGAKVQISGYAYRSGQRVGLANVGSATLIAIATCTPIIVALLPILKDLGIKGSPEEEKELIDGIDAGKKELMDNPEFEKSNVKTDADFTSGKVEGDTETTEMPSWILPVALIGGGGLLYFATKK